MSDRQQTEQLKEHFAKDLIRVLPQKNLAYVPVAEVVARLNAVLGAGGWSVEVIRVARDEIATDWVCAHVRLRGNCDGQEFAKDGVGGTKIKVKRDGELNDIGDDYKSACSDALKKAAQLLGVGLELARTEEALRHEEAEETPKASPDTMQELEEQVKSLSDEARRDFVMWWNRLTGDGDGGKRFRSGTVTVEEADQAFQRLKALVDA